MIIESCICLMGKPLEEAVRTATELKNFAVSSSVMDGQNPTVHDISGIVLLSQEIAGLPVALYADAKQSTLWITTTSLLQPVFFIPLSQERFDSDQTVVLDWVAQNAATNTPVQVLCIVESDLMTPNDAAQSSEPAP